MQSVVRTDSGRHLFTREGLRGFPSDYRAPIRAQLARTVLSHPGQPSRPLTDAEIVMAGIGRMVVLALEEPTPATYRASVSASLASFATLMDSFSMLSARSPAPESSLESALAAIDAWGGDTRVDEFEHGLMLMRRSGALVSEFAELAPCDPDLDERLAREWNGYRAAFAWSLVASLAVTNRPLMVTHPVADAVYDDLIAYAREAYRVARSAYGLRVRPNDESDT